MKNELFYLKRLASDIDYELSEKCNKLSTLYLFYTPNSTVEVAKLEGEILSLISVRDKIRLEIKVCEKK